MLPLMVPGTTRILSNKKPPSSIELSGFLALKNDRNFKFAKLTLQTIDISSKTSAKVINSFMKDQKGLMR
jgi:primosomal replication protein N